MEQTEKQSAFRIANMKKAENEHGSFGFIPFSDKTGSRSNQSGCWPLATNHWPETANHGSFGFIPFSDKTGSCKNPSENSDCNLNNTDRTAKREWQLAVGCWLLAVGCWLLASSNLLFAICQLQIRR